jgi:hypothetical protein
VGAQWVLRRCSRRRERCWGTGGGDRSAWGDDSCKRATANRCGQTYRMFLTSLRNMVQKVGGDENEKAFSFSFFLRREERA